MKNLIIEPEKVRLFKSLFSYLLLIAGSCVFLCSCHLKQPKQVSASDFGAIPNDNQNDAQQLRKAIDYCKINPGTTLYIPSGVYNFRDEQAVQLMNDVMSGKFGQNPEKTIFKPYYPYVKGLDFNGLHDITIEAAGAILLCDGWMEPVSLENCKNVRLKGLTIDYKRKPYSIGKIVDVQPGYFDADFDSIYPINSKTPIPRMKFWDLKAHRMFPEPIYFPKIEIIKPQKVRFYSKVDEERNGNLVMIPHSFHFRPAILILEAENIDIEDVTIHAQPGMGIVGHRSKNITLTGLRIVPGAGSVQSTNTDATHFTSCTGLIHYENCQFEGQGDDAVNIHNYYYTIQKPAKGKGYDLVVKVPTHASVLDYPDAGDTLELVEKSSLAVVKKFVVKSTENNIPELRSQVMLNEEPPSDLDNYLFINSTRLPKVEIIGCTITSNLARGILIKTRNVLIERCLIREATGTGIVCAAESSWYEGVPTANMIIRYNRIVRCGRGAGSQGTCGIAIKIDAKNTKVSGLHKNILIEGNIIEGENAVNGIFISGACDVVVRYNEISGCVTPIKVRYSYNVNVYSNPAAADIKEKKIE